MGDITQENKLGFNTDGMDITAVQEESIPERVGLDEDQAHLKAAAYADVAKQHSTPQSKEETYQRIKDQLLTMGSSDELDDFEQTVTSTRQLRFGEEQVQSLLEARFGKEEVIRNMSDAVQAGIVTVEDEQLLRYGETSQAEPSLLLDEKNFVGVEPFNYSEWVASQNEARFAVDAAVAPIVADLDPSFSSLTVDFLAEIVPFALSNFSRKLAVELERGQGGSFVDRFMAGVRGFVAPGEIRNDIRDLVMRTSPEDRPEFARQLARLIKDKSGIISDNDTETIDWIENVVSSADEDRSGADWDRILYNAITLLDAIPFLSKLGRSGKGALTSHFSRLGRTNRKRLSSFIKEELENPDTLRGLTIPREDLATGQLPKTTMKDLDSTPSVISDDLGARLPNAATVIRGTDNTAINYSAGELNSVVERLRTAYQSVKGGHMQINQFVVDVSQGDRVVTQAMYSRTRNGGGWLSPKSALNAAEKLSDGDLAGVRLVIRDNDGSLRAIETGPELRRRLKGTSAKPDGEEYFIQFKDTHFVSETDLMAFSGNPVFFTGPFGSGRYLGDATAQFSEEVWKPAFVSMGREQLFMKEAINLADNFWGLNRAGRNRVTRIIERGSSEKRVFTPSELAVMENGKMTVADMKGYYGFRAANDAVWATANNRAFKELSVGGFRQMAKVDGTDMWLVRPHTSSDGAVKRAYNPKTGEIDEVTPEMIATWEKKGGGIEVSHVNAPIPVKGEDTIFIIRTGGTDTELSQLPLSVLRYENGYVSRIAKDQFFITRTDVIKRNGKSIERPAVVHTARTQVEAERQAAELSASTGHSHSVKDSVLDNGNSKIVNDTMVLEQDRLIYGRRNEDPLTRANGELTPIADPVEALHRAVDATARSIGIEDYVKTQEAKFLHTFSDVIDKDIWRAYQSNRFTSKAVSESLGELAKGSGAKAAKAQEAKQLWDYYAMLRGTSEPKGMWAWRAGVRRTASLVERMTGSTSLGEFIQNLDHIDPFAVLKGATFTTLISANPARQFALQSAQFMFLFGAGPRSAVSAAGHGMGIRAGLAAIDTPGWPGARKGLAKVMRIPEDEAEILVRQFKNSGLVAEIDSYGYIGAQLTEPSLAYRPTMFGATVQSVGNAIKSPFNLMKRAGFNQGEMVNLSLTWTFAVKNHLRRTGKSISDLSLKEWQEVSAQASGYALSMHKAGTLAYQQGLMSVFTQFWSIQHKAVSAMLPAVVGGSRAFTPGQKVGVLATQIGMYGAAGLGIEELVRDIMAETGALDNLSQEKAQQVTRIVSSGAMEMFLNAALADADGVPTDLDFSGSFAPAGAPVSTVTDFFTTLMSLGLTEAFSSKTAAGSTFGRYADMADYIKFTLAMSDTLPNTPTKLERIMAVSPQVFSGYSNAVKAFYAMRTGQLVTSFGDHRTHITYREAVMKGLLGVATNAETDLRRLYNLDGKNFGFTQNNAEEIAATIYKAMLKNISTFEGMSDSSMTRMAAAFEGERVILEILDDNEKEQVRLAFVKLASRRRGKPDDIFMRLHTMAFEGGAATDRIYSEVRTNLFSEDHVEERDTLLRLIQQMMEGRNERSEWMLEENLKLQDTNSFYLRDDE